MRSPAVSVTAPLNEIPLSLPGQDPFADPAAIPLRRGRGTRASTPFAVALRGTGGNVALTLTGPDGRTAKLSRKLS
jgi:hypothetical protein